jgi:4'-phosphopantetheinyl transferase EntD
MIDRLVPSAVATAESREDLLDIQLFPEEETSLGHAVEKRRREFITGRACARLALRRLGIAATPIPNGVHGEPLWPAGVVGSITHCRGYRACAVANADRVASLGVDVEPNVSLPHGVLEHVAFGREREVATQSAALARDRRVCVDRLLFSAKEAAYKAWFPLAERWLGFEDSNLSIDMHEGSFCARLLVSGPVVSGVRLTELRGRWRAEDSLIATAVVVPR